jgi:hypothetical protein
VEATGYWWLTPIIPATQEAEVRLNKKKNHKKGLAERLKVKAPSSSPRPPKKKRERQRE